MYYDDHNPSHFHVVYGEHRAMISISPLRVIEGALPRRAQGLVFEWAAMHQVELEQNWQRAVERLNLEQITPLD
jgi:hypothetical protein